MHEAVAAHNQYLLGEKTKALTMSPASKEYKCLPSFKSQSMVIPSFPPEAANEPSGETERVLMYPVCPWWLVLSLHLDNSQTCTKAKKMTREGESAFPIRAIRALRAEAQAQKWRWGEGKGIFCPKSVEMSIGIRDLGG
jgi:hypothetical protein